jgi:hypothetical protein
MRGIYSAAEDLLAFYEEKEEEEDSVKTDHVNCVGFY